MGAETYAAAPPSQGGWRSTVQRFGGNLAAMVMPNIGAFIAWGLLTALFIDTGWIPNEGLATIVDPMIFYLLPILIGYTGGRLVHDQRGAVIGAIATVGIIVGSDIPQFLGAMIIGPLSAWLLLKFDQVVVPRTRSGFEMLVNNFSLGILGLIMTIVGFYAIGPVVEALTGVLGAGVEVLVDNRLLPLASILIEPAKVLFLNNAINHGVLSPLAVVEAEQTGRSILFMLETNPGPGLGVLLAFWLAGPRAMRPTVPGAAIIHFFGGIHEIYFPYVLMKPQMIIAAIAGGATGVLTFLLTGSGLVATPSPGSIFAYLAVTPRGGYFGVLLGILLSAAVSFGVGAVLLRMSRTEAEREDLEAARKQSRENKGVVTAPAEG
jgi:PTS system mannitol-specific IIC component